jgi:hypothetical protein
VVRAARAFAGALGPAEAAAGDAVVTAVGGGGPDDLRTRGAEPTFEAIAREVVVDKVRGIIWQDGATGDLLRLEGHDYVPGYVAYLEHMRPAELVVLEIGIGCVMRYGGGHSIRLWRRYLPRANLYLIDIVVVCV